MALMGYREYARHRGCSLKAVQKAIKDGRIAVVLAEGNAKRIDSEVADVAWDRNTDPAKQSVLHSAGPAALAGVQTPASAAPALDDDEDLEDLPAAEDEKTKEYREARTAREKLKLAREQRDFEIEGGNLIALDEAMRLASTAFRQLRDAILHVPARVKDAAAAETNPDVIEQLLEEELGSALGAFDPKSVLKEQDVDEDVQEPGP